MNVVMHASVMQSATASFPPIGSEIMYRAISIEKLLKIAKLQRMQNRSAAGRLKIAHDSTDGEENLCFDDAIRALRETLANQLLCCRCLKTTSPSVTARCVLFPAPRVLLTQATLQEALGGMLAVEPGVCTTGTRTMSVGRMMWHIACLFPRGIKFLYVRP